MNSCVAASEAVAPAKPAWRAVYSLGLGVFGLITAEFLPASLLTPMAASLGVSEGMAGQAVTATALVAGGGLLYTIGAVIYAMRRPDPSPTVFGYHEIFHLLVIAAAGLQYAVIAFWVLPGG